MADDVRFAFSPSMHEEIIKLCQNETDRDVIEGARLGYYDDEDAKPKDMSQYYSDEEIQKYGVVGIEIKKV